MDAPKVWTHSQLIGVVGFVFSKQNTIIGKVFGPYVVLWACAMFPPFVYGPFVLPPLAGFTGIHTILTSGTGTIHRPPYFLNTFSLSKISFWKFHAKLMA